MGKEPLISVWPDETCLFYNEMRGGLICFDTISDHEHQAELSITALMYEDHAGTILTEPITVQAGASSHAVMFELPEGATDPVFKLDTSATTIINRRIITGNATINYSDATSYQVSATNFDPLLQG